MSLAILHFEGVTPEKFAILQNSAIKEMGGGNHTETTGTISDHGATADYSYDGVNVLTVTVEKVSRIFFHKPSIDEVQGGIQKWIEDTLAETQASATAVNDVKPFVDTTKPVTQPVPVVTQEENQQSAGKEVDPITQEKVNTGNSQPTVKPVNAVDPITNKPTS